MTAAAPLSTAQSRLSGKGKNASLASTQPLVFTFPPPPYFCASIPASLAELTRAADLHPPTLIVIGKVVALAQDLDWYAALARSAKS